MTAPNPPWKAKGDQIIDACGNVLMTVHEMPILKAMEIARLVESAPELHEAAMCLTVMRTNHDGSVTIGPVGWKRLQAVLEGLQ